MRKMRNMMEKIALALSLVGENVRGAHYVSNHNK